MNLCVRVCVYIYVCVYMCKCVHTCKCTIRSVAHNVLFVRSETVGSESAQQQAATQCRTDVQDTVSSDGFQAAGQHNMVEGQRAPNQCHANRKHDNNNDSKINTAKFGLRLLTRRFCFSSLWDRESYGLLRDFVTTHAKNIVLFRTSFITPQSNTLGHSVSRF